MNPAKTAVHQFHAACAPGDGVTNSMMLIRKLLRSFGCRSEIYCAEVPPALQHDMRPLAAYKDDDNQVLLVHHSMGHDYGDWLEGLLSRLILVYHNITPPALLPYDGNLRHYAELGRLQLHRWASRFERAIAVSPFNAAELVKMGYRDPAIIPLLVDLEQLNAQEPNARLVKKLRLDPALKLLFVGRLIEHKCQDVLVEVLSHLRRRMRRPATLVLAGRTDSDRHAQRVRERAEELGVEGAIDIRGPVPLQDLVALYKACDVFVSVSDHEGFGMPLVEAMAHQLPVVAYNAGNISDTLGGSGILLDGKDPATVAAAIKVIAEEPELRHRIIASQNKNIERFSRQVLEAALCEFLNRMGISAVPIAPPVLKNRELDFLVEGPFTGTYSLSLVNRELARALMRQGYSVGLRATEGDGDFEPDPSSLARYPDLRAAYDRGTASRAATALRNLYPPRTTDMRGDRRVFSVFAWEESGFPAATVDAFNASLHLITVPSRFVEKILVDNGVHAPIAVVGEGIDHVVHEEPPEASRAPVNDRFTFLHVSSGFPRKGVDILLDAWVQAFTAGDQVRLIIKTFPNPHNDVRDRLEALRLRAPDLAEISLVDCDLDDDDLIRLLRGCDALVAPSRGEGFGLPLAEAMSLGKPVITTRYGGQADFCTEETAWLVDFCFSRARSHLELSGSVWMQPDVQGLSQALRNVYGATSEARRLRALKGQEVVRTRYSWGAVAERTAAALADLDTLPAPEPLPRVGWVTTWQTRCGIASYAKYLARAFPSSRIEVFAARTASGEDSDGPNVRRCWNEGWSDPLEELYSEIRSADLDCVVIQHNFGFFDFQAFARLLDRLNDDGLDTYVYLHRTAELVTPHQRTLRDIAAPLARCRRLFVHGISDLNRLKHYGLVENVTLFPHGVVRYPLNARRDRPQSYRSIATFGFLLPNKGFPELIRAVAQLRSTGKKIRLNMMTALYPVSESEEERRLCQTLIEEHGLEDVVSLRTDYTSDEAVLAELAQSELVVFPYQTTQESASGAVRFGLASGRPVMCTPLQIFDDVDSVVLRLPGVHPPTIAAGISEFLAGRFDTKKLNERQQAWLAEHDWMRLSNRLLSMVRYFRRVKNAQPAPNATHARTFGPEGG